MNKRMRYCLWALLGLLMAGNAQAQTAYWTIQPTYQGISPFSQNLYKVRTYSNMSLVDKSGAVVANCTADSITNLTNGYALALISEGGKYRITGIIDQNGQVTPVREEVYAGDYPFFSEDKCAVYNKKGKYGFMNPGGAVVIPCTYVAVHPYREGLASVSKAKGSLMGLVTQAASMVSSDVKVQAGPSTYIDARGIAIKFQNEVGTPYVASSFKNGRALVQNKEGKTFMIDNLGKIVSMEPNVKFVFDDYFALVEEGGKAERANVAYPLPYDTSYSRFEQGGRYGFRRGGAVILPAQFEAAGSVYQHCVIVKTQGKYGMVGFTANTPYCNVRDDGGRLVVTASLPAVWDNKNISLYRIVNGSDRSSFVLNGNSGSRTLAVDVDDAVGTKVYELEGEQLVLWRSSDVVDEPEEEEVATPGRAATGSRGGISVSAPSTVKANNKGICSVPVRVTNNSGSTLSITVTLSTGDSKSVTVGAGRSGSVTLTAKVMKDTKCTIRATSSAGSRTCTTTLKPFFVL